jgi:tetratricopeptide (TPR) repeat protein
MRRPSLRYAAAGIPLAIELAAARVRALTLTEIVDSLHDRFRLLTGGSRIAVRRQQTLRASVDWSHALLTESERILFRRLAVFLGGFDLGAAQFICGSGDLESYQVLDQLTLLVDKSLVVADDSERTTRYRLLETVRQYALEKLGESGEADAIRSRHRDHYTSMAAALDAPAGSDYEQRLQQADAEIDNLRSAFGWSLESADVQQALALTSSLQPLWFSRGRMREGRAWIDLALGGDGSNAAGVEAAIRARALADKAVLDCWVGTSTDKGADQARQALAIARELGDDALLARTLTTCGFVAGQRYDVAAARTYFTEAIDLVRASDDRWRLSQILTWQADTAIVTGHPVAGREAVEEGLRVADSISDRPNARGCRFYLGYVQLMAGEVSSAVAQFREVADESETARDSLVQVAALMGLGNALVYLGEVSAARAAGLATLDAGGDVDDYFSGLGYSVLTQAGLAEGDVPAAREANEAA